METARIRAAGVHPVGLHAAALVRARARRIIDDYYVIERSPFVLVVAIQDQSIALVRQYRPATDKYYLSLPAGYIGADESDLEAAESELFEETGITGNGFRRLGELDPLPGYIRSPAHIVCCHFDEIDYDIQDTTEIEDRHIVPIDRAERMVAEGEIVGMQAVSAIGLARFSGCSDTLR